MPEIKTRMGKGLIEELDAIAEDMEVTRSEAIRTALRLGINQLEEPEGEEEDEEESDDEETEEEEDESEDEEETKA